MDHIQDYVSLPENEPIDRTSWGSDWSDSVSPWGTSTPLVDMPFWQYTAAALDQSDYPMSYHPDGTSINLYKNSPSSVTSVLSGPGLADFPSNLRFTSVGPVYDAVIKPVSSRLPVPKQVSQSYGESLDNEEMVDDEDSDGYLWEGNPISTGLPASSSRPTHRRTHSANEISSKNPKRGHTVVERNYRDRLNDKIADLALYLFETSSDSRTKPSKSLVMTRAKEMLKQLDARNKSLEEEVVKLRQQIAILDHIVASKKGDSDGPPKVL